jgi:hypothetical protein
MERVPKKRVVVRRSVFESLFERCNAIMQVLV